ncbi:MAG: hypothetical protein GXP16_02305 [Gammaproteobacteria bacterium]|nr:hypothetical protein [Gammaproteobacteria bacterium]
MTFLILKIFLYLVLAGSIGAAAGWLFRNLQAQKMEERANRAVHDAKSKVPQLESLLRGRDEQVQKYKNEMKENKVMLAEAQHGLRDVEQRHREQERETKHWRQKVEAEKPASLDEFDLHAEASDDQANKLISELSAEISGLKQKLAQLQTSPKVDNTTLIAEFDALALQLKSTERKLTISTRDLTQEQLKVTELERERELQNKSLQVLHQQLDMERSQRAANG